MTQFSNSKCQSNESLLDEPSISNFTEMQVTGEYKVVADCGEEREYLGKGLVSNRNYIRHSPVKYKALLSCYVFIFHFQTLQPMASKFLFSKLSKPLLGGSRNMMVNFAIIWEIVLKELTCFTIYSIVVV